MKLRFVHISLQLNMQLEEYPKKFKRLNEIPGNRIEEILRLPEACYPREFVRISDGSNKLLSRAHFRHEDKEYFPAFELLAEDGTIVNKDYDMYYLRPGKNELVKCYYDVEQNLFFDMPFVKYVPKGNYLAWGNDLAKGALGSIFAGDSDIVFRNKIDGTEYKYVLRVLPSSLTQESFKAMIDDLISINVKLLLTKEAESSQYLTLFSSNGLWQDMMANLKKLQVLFEEIALSPYSDLSFKLGKASVQGLKKYDAHIFQELLQKPFAKQVTVRERYESYDIYEHRFIKHVLHSLQSMLKYYDQYSSNFVAREIDRTNKQLTSFLQKYGFQDNDFAAARRFFNLFLQSDKPWSVLEYGKRQAYFNRMRNLLVPSQISTAYIYGDTRVDYTLPEERKVEAYNQEWRKNVSFRCYFSNGTLYSCYTLRDTDGKIYLKLHNPDFYQHVLFYRCVRSLDINGTYVFYGHYIRKTNSAGDKINVEVEFADLTPGRLGGIDTFVIGNARDCFRSIFCESRYKNYTGLEGVETDAKLYFSLLNRKERLEQCFTNDTDQLAEKKQLLYKAIDELLEYDFLKAAGTEIEELHSSQVFDNDSRYEAVFNLLTHFDDQLELNLLNDAEKILLKKTDKLYEYWLLAKMVELLVVEQKWTVSGLKVGKKGQELLAVPNVMNSSIINEIGKILSSESSKDAHNKTLEIILSHACGLELTIYFNVSKSVPFLADSELTPDFLLKIEDTSKWIYEANRRKFFVLDAKYRNYNEMGSGAFWEDIEEVSITKYLTRLQNLSASFIVSTGSVVDRDGLLEADDKASSWIYWGGERSAHIASTVRLTSYAEPNHHYGSFICIPGDETDQLKKFFKLLFEHYMNKRNVCWNCGHVIDYSNEGECDTKVINAEYGNYVYHLTCSQCNEFWVESYCGLSGCNQSLTKHVDNYHTEVDEGYPWYVKCPVCGDY